MVFLGGDDFWPFRLFSHRPCRRRWCELPCLGFRSDWTTGTAAPEFRGPTSSTMEIAQYFAIFSAAKIFLSGENCWTYRLSRRPYRRHWCELPRLDLGSGWTTGTAALVFRGLTSSAMQIARYLTFFSVATIFGVVASLIATPGGEITTRAVGRPQLGLWYLMDLRRPFKS